MKISRRTPTPIEHPTISQVNDVVEPGLVPVTGGVEFDVVAVQRIDALPYLLPLENILSTHKI